MELQRWRMTHPADPFQLLFRFPRQRVGRALGDTEVQCTNELGTCEKMVFVWKQMRFLWMNWAAFFFRVLFWSRLVGPMKSRLTWDLVKTCQNLFLRRIFGGRTIHSPAILPHLRRAPWNLEAPAGRGEGRPSMRCSCGQSPPRDVHHAPRGESPIWPAWNSHSNSHKWVG